MRQYVFIYVGNDFYTSAAGGAMPFPLREELTDDFASRHDFIWFGMADGAECVATEARADEVIFREPARFVTVGFRDFYLASEENDFARAVRGRQFAQFGSHSRFCPKCGVRTERLAFNAQRCPECGFEIYPTITPACIVLVKRGDDEILMVRSLTFKTNMYGLVAGFVEAGESLEQCVERELAEETSIRVKNLRYFGSQPWPFPSTMMVGFVADYASGEVRLQREELAAGGFFHRDNLPELPRKMSIARKMIDAWIERRI